MKIVLSRDLIQSCLKVKSVKKSEGKEQVAMKRLRIKFLAVFVSLFVLFISFYSTTPVRAGEQGDFVYPCSTQYVINQGYLYGENTGSGYGHTGVDIGSGFSGFSVLAAEQGTIVEATTSGGAYGTTIVISHGNGKWTRYAHLSQITKSSGTVSKGEPIGYSGNTGNSSGAHLHFEVMVNSNNYYNVTNPEMWLNRSDDGYACAKGQVKSNSTGEWLGGVRISGLPKTSPDSSGYGASYTYLRNSAGNWPLDITQYSMNYHVARVVPGGPYNVKAEKSGYITQTKLLSPSANVTSLLNFSL